MATTKTSLMQGENSQMSVVSDMDLTTMIANARATASVGAIIVSGATAIATSLKVDDGTASLLRKGPLGAGVRAYLPTTNEWILITAISGINITVTRAQVDPGAVPTVAKAILANSQLNIVPIDSVPVIAMLDPADPTNKTAIIELAPDDTKVLATTYDFQITLQDDPVTPNNRRIFSSKKGNIGQLEILPDPNFFGA
jgi:hypothetical protein